MSIENHMADSTELKAFARLEGAVGGVSALKLCAFFSNQTLYVPQKIAATHAIAMLIGMRDAQYLAAELGGSDVFVPACELTSLRRAGKLRRMLRQRGMTPTGCADELGVTGRQARRLAATLLQLEGHPIAALFSPGDTA